MLVGSSCIKHDFLRHISIAGTPLRFEYRCLMATLNVHRGNDLGYGKNFKYWAIRSGFSKKRKSLDNKQNMNK